MEFMFKFIFYATIFQIVNCDTVFSNQYLGTYLTEEEYKSREKCETNVCIFDADRLIYAATRNGTVKPCDDFKTFAMGEFYLHRKKSDRQPAIGFQLEVDKLLKERFRNVLKAPIQKDDLKIHKFLKTYFKLCTDTDHITKHGGDEVIAYLNSLGGSPLIADGTWDETKFDVGKLLEVEPWAPIFLTDHGILRCKAPSEDSETKADSICFFQGAQKINEKLDLLKVFPRFDFDKSQERKAVEDYEEVLKISNYSFNSGATRNNKTIRVKDLITTFPQLNINWLNFINSRLFSTLQITEDEEIYIRYPEYFNHTLTMLSKMDKGVIANAFTIKFLLSNIKFFATHFLSIEGAKYHGTKQGHERFETCIDDLLWTGMKLGLDSLLSKKKFNTKIQSAAKELIRDVIADFLIETEKQKTFNETEEVVKQEVIGKLKNIRLQVMFLDEELNDTIIEEIHSELDFNESMSFIELQLSMELFFVKAHYEKEPKFIANLISKYEDDILYAVDENVLVVPVEYTLPPFFVVDRPRFFNVATLYTFVHNSLSTGIRNYQNRKKIDLFFLDLDKVSLADKYYVKWEENGGKELQLSSFRLTNRQMLWLCMAHVYAVQYQGTKNQTFNPLTTLQTDYFHLNFKRQQRFRDAYQCEYLTYEEKKLLLEYQMAAKLLRKEMNL